jgi:hypothetical protein
MNEWMNEFVKKVDQVETQFVFIHPDVLQTYNKNRTV